LQSLRVPGSFIDDRFGTGTGSINARFFRGSGTSQAAAVATGAVALLLEARPTLNPDQVKSVLMSSARTLYSSTPAASGAGLVNVKRALSTSVPSTNVAHQGHRRSTGYGSLDAARGTAHLSLGDLVLTGDEDIFGHPYDTHAQADAEESADGPSHGAWNGATFNGQTWAGQTWAGGTWVGQTWSGQTWADATWTGQTWAGTDWTGQTWADAQWTGQTWAGQTWAGQTWAGQSWGGQSWSGQSWGSAGWTGQSWSVGNWS
jgi:serine protease AprX